MTYRWIVLFALLSLPLTALCDEGAATDATAAAEESLPTNVIARIDGRDIPAEWFQHEFRSTFFRYKQSDDVREAVFKPFLNRMLVAAKAREMHLDEDPQVKNEIERRLAGMRAFMEYQLAMTEIGILNGALVKELGINTSPEGISDEEVAAYFEKNIKGKPGAPSTADALPVSAVQNIRMQLTQTKIEKELTDRLAEWSNDMDVKVNRDVVESVPMPEMKGTPPPGFGPTRAPAEPSQP